MTSFLAVTEYQIVLNADPALESTTLKVFVISVPFFLGSMCWNYLVGISMLSTKLYEQQTSLKILNFTHHNTNVTAFNAFTSIEVNRPFSCLSRPCLGIGPAARWINPIHPAAHEANLIDLFSDLAQRQLSWQPHWNFDICLERTDLWYRQLQEGASPFECCLVDLQAYEVAAHAH